MGKDTTQKIDFHGNPVDPYQDTVAINPAMGNQNNYDNGLDDLEEIQDQSVNQQPAFNGELQAQAVEEDHTQTQAKKKKKKKKKKVAPQQEIDQLNGLNQELEEVQRQELELQMQQEELERLR